MVVHSFVIHWIVLHCSTLLNGVKVQTMGRWLTSALFAKSKRCFNLEVRFLEPGQTAQNYKSAPITKPRLIEDYQNISLHLLFVAVDVDSQVFTGVLYFIQK